MQYLLFSDAHGDEEIINKIVDHYQNEKDMFDRFYNGDSELPADYPAFENVTTVGGNQDTDKNFHESNTVYELDADFTILQVHGHLENISTKDDSIDKLAAQAKDGGYQVVTFGHTHELMAEMRDGILMINPGSISDPRGEYKDLKGTYAILSLPEDRSQFVVQFYTRDLKPVKDLKFIFDRPGNGGLQGAFGNFDFGQLTSINLTDIDDSKNSDK